MNYQWHYNRLIETRKHRELVDGQYYERHHILPKSMGGEDGQENIVHLTAREHFLAHWLLWRIYRNRETASAFSCITKFLLKRNGYVASARLFEESRIASSEACSKLKTGKKLSDETKQKIGNSQLGKSHPSIQPADIGIRRSEGLIGHIVTDSTKELIAVKRFSGKTYLMQNVFQKRIHIAYVEKYLSLGWKFVKDYERNFYYAK